ncbi:hypothetical protein AQZ50_10940 [Novosphingobium sp. Fuku2-ISO-50]|jgi:hypothetical protein|nr:hypothetical protein AQZ50_10940 [Novosphingobium sp. Fuku2-ISO-50]
MYRSFSKRILSMMSCKARLVMLAVLAPVALSGLSGCGKGTQAPAGKAAGAQVLPGTISDSMLDLDRSQAQPLLQPVQRSRPSAADIMGEDTGGAASDAAPDKVAPDKVGAPKPADEKPKQP